MIYRLFQMKQENGENFPKAVKTWITKVIGGAIIADGILHPNERTYLEELFQQMSDYPEALLLIRETIKLDEPPPIEPIEVDLNLAIQILKTILEICASDHLLTATEIQYVKQVAQAMNLDQTRVQKLIGLTIRRVKSEFFSELLEELQENEKFWLASLILKTIYADGFVDSKEIPYLNDVFQLLNGDVERLENVKADAKNIRIQNLPKVVFSDPIKEKILRYLLELMCSVQDTDTRELELIHEVALSILQYTPKELEGLTEYIQNLRSFMEVTTS